MTTLTQLEYIITVYKEGSFSKAALKCHVSQPSLSAQVKKAESLLGFVLFDRSKKPVQATPRGLAYIKQAQVVLREHKRLDFFQSETGVPSGPFHLGVIPSLAPFLIPLFVEDFAKAFPQVRLKISEMKTEDILKELERESLDCGLLVTPLKDERFQEKILFYEEFLVYTSKSHPLAQRKILAEKDLEAHPIWLLEEGHCFRDQVIEVCSQNKRDSVLENVDFESGSLETLIRLIRNGVGYTLLPQLASQSLSPWEVKNQIKTLKKPVPTREVSLACLAAPLKSQIIDGLEKQILRSLPDFLNRKKPAHRKVIDIV